MMYRQVFSDQYFSSYSDLKVFEALNYIKKGNTGISQTMAATEFSLVSFESASKFV